MHEMSIVMRFVDIAKEYAIKNNAQKVYKVVLQIGELTGVVPSYLQMFYPAVVEGTILEGSELVVEVVEGSVFCKNCGATYNPSKTDMKCPECKSEACDVIDGNHMFVSEIAIGETSATEYNYAKNE